MRRGKDLAERGEEKGVSREGEGARLVHGGEKGRQEGVWAMLLVLS